MKNLKAILLTTLLLGGLTVSAADAKAKKPAKYPLDKCVVSDEKLDSMGEPYVFKHEGREVRLCCKSCLKDFQKEPAKYLKKLDEAEKKQSKQSKKS